MPSTVLFRSSSGLGIVVDLPTSIQNGQVACRSLRSATAPLSPYPSTEPKGAKRDTLLAATPHIDRLDHEEIQACISYALADIRPHVSLWCHPRFVSTISLHPVLRISDISPGDPIILSSTELETQFRSLRELENSVVFNPQLTIVHLRVSGLGTFYIPPGSKFILGSLHRGLPALEKAHQSIFGPSLQFDLVLMDPPWSNRSVRNARAYRMQENQTRDPFQDGLRVVARFLAPQGWVAIWTTNKASIRAQVREQLETLGFKLNQRWIWIKICTNGEPVTQLDGVWRHPYETLLLFRRKQTTRDVTQRVVVAVSDVHSRKPCLKELFEEFLPRDYIALELFARSLTSGWWSWGDEVLRFQHESQWAERDDHHNEQKDYSNPEHRLQSPCHQTGVPASLPRHGHADAGRLVTG
jgi:N6-adenosine-specific RNA methylase IME4